MLMMLQEDCRFKEILARVISRDLYGGLIVEFFRYTAGTLNLQENQSKCQNEINNVLFFILFLHVSVDNILLRLPQKAVAECGRIIAPMHIGPIQPRW